SNRRSRVSSAVQVANGCDPHDPPSFLRLDRGSNGPARVALPAVDLQLAGIAVAVLVDLAQVLLPRQQGPAADAIGGCGLVFLATQPRDELAHHPGRHLFLLGGEGESERDQLPEDHLPVIAETAEDVLPVELRASA